MEKIEKTIKVDNEKDFLKAIKNNKNSIIIFREKTQQSSFLDNTYIKIGIILLCLYSVWFIFFKIIPDLNFILENLENQLRK